MDLTYRLTKTFCTFASEADKQMEHWPLRQFFRKYRVFTSAGRPHKLPKMHCSWINLEWSLVWRGGFIKIFHPLSPIKFCYFICVGKSSFDSFNFDFIYVFKICIWPELLEMTNILQTTFLWVHLYLEQNACIIYTLWYELIKGQDWFR